MNRDSSNSLRLSFALSHAATTPIDNMDDHELRQLRIECVNELKSFVSFFNIGGVDHTHGGFCCGLSHAGKRLTDQKFVWFNGRGVWTEPTQSYSLAQLEASFKVVPAVPGIPDRLTALEAVADSWRI